MTGPPEEAAEQNVILTSFETPIKLEDNDNARKDALRGHMAAIYRNLRRMGTDGRGLFMEAKWKRLPREAGEHRKPAQQRWMGNNIRARTSSAQTDGE
jgi:hypothetical protein